jgi:hypothetical protein
MTARIVCGTRLERFLAGVQEFPATIRAMLCQAATGSVSPPTRAVFVG